MAVCSSAIQRASPLAAAAAVVLCTAAPVLTQSASTAPPVVPCALTFASPRFIPISGKFGAIAIDDACEHVYVTNIDQNRVEDFSLKTLAFNAPIAVGAKPAGMDFRPRTNLLYVANSAGSSISVVDVVKRLEARRISTPSPWLTESPFSIAFPDGGFALFSTRYDGSTGGRMMQLNLATEESTVRSDFQVGFNERASHPTRLKASGDRRAVAIAQGGDSGGLVARYDATTNTFAQRSLQSFLSNVALSRTGLVMAAVPGAYVLDAAVNLSGTVVRSSSTHHWGGIEVSPDGRVAYRSLGGKIDVMNAVTFLKTGELPLGDTLENAYFDNAGYMDLSNDGRLLAVITDRGISLVRTDALAFTDEVLQPGLTPLKAAHISELRARIDAQRTRFGLASFGWTDAALGGVVARAIHVSEMRTALQQAYSSAGWAPPVFAETLSPGITVVKAAHVAELRRAVLTLEVN